MSAPSLASHTRIFDWKAQEDFALFSGDRNPIHMDPVAARQTQAGHPTVHGVHSVLWALDVLAHNRVLQQPLAQLKVRFQKFIYVGNEVTLEIVRQDAAGIRLQLRVDDELLTTSVDLTFGDATPATARDGFSGMVPKPSWPKEPAELSLGQMDQASGWLAFARTNSKVAKFFPSLAAAIGPRRVAGLACMSRLVGMVCPGLHSIFSGFTVRAVDQAAESEAIHFHVTSVDERFRLIEQSIEGGGWAGTIESFVRVHRIAQSPDYANAERRTAGYGARRFSRRRKRPV